MSATTHYELAAYGPSGVRYGVSEGLGVVNDPIHYKSARGARNGRPRLIGDGLLPLSWRVVVLKVEIEELPNEPTHEKENADAQDHDHHSSAAARAV